MARPAAQATELPLKVPMMATWPPCAGSASRITSADPPTPLTAYPLPMALPKVVRSGLTPAICWNPPSACRKPVMTSSKISTLPRAAVSSRSPSR